MTVVTVVLVLNHQVLTAGRETKCENWKNSSQRTTDYGLYTLHAIRYTQTLTVNTVSLCIGSGHCHGPDLVLDPGSGPVPEVGTADTGIAEVDTGIAEGTAGIAGIVVVRTVVEGTVEVDTAGIAVVDNTE